MTRFESRHIPAVVNALNRAADLLRESADLLTNAAPRAHLEEWAEATSLARQALDKAILAQCAAGARYDVPGFEEDIVIPLSWMPEGYEGDAKPTPEQFDDMLMEKARDLRTLADELQKEAEA